MAAPILDDPARTLGDLLRVGVVASVDLAAARATVQLDDETRSPPVPWLAARAGDVSVWCPPSVGEQVLLLCPEGELSAGAILPGLFSDSNAAPAASANTLIVFSDGTRLSYDRANRELAVSMAEAGRVFLDAPGGFTLVGDVTVQGDLTVIGDAGVMGSVTATEDVTAAGKSLKTHKHTAVAAGGAVSGPPQ